MAKVKLYNLKGEAAGDVTLDDKVFGVEVDSKIVQFVANAQRANAFLPYAHTKDRGDVSGGGKKPWRQKGTGRARQGSIRSPQWRGGGSVFGPRNTRNQDTKVNKKVRLQAIRMVLSDKLAHDTLIVVDSFDSLTGKTKELSSAFTKLPVKRSSALLASEKKADMLNRASRNLPRVNAILAGSVNVRDLLSYKFLVIDKSGAETLAKQLLRV
jgi:large subunit ribosomal protein L4